ncbi:EamA family transporter [Brevibacterium album]|uniref:EamA family transporter n=1 Tax=Brevibacterium album TaxID=417948 RepID=UPI000420ABBE|nr:EamA family transporter [Brevibacterium album]
MTTAPFAQTAQQAAAHALLRTGAAGQAHAAAEADARTAAGRPRSAGRTGARGALQVATAASLWGVGAAVAALVFAASALSPAALTFWRFALAAAILLALHTLRRILRGGPGLGVLLREQGLALAITGVLLAAAQSLMYAAVASMGAGLGSTLVLATGPIVMAVLSIPMLGLTLNRAGWLTMIPAIAALIALLAVSGADASLTLLGPVLAVAASTSHSLMTLVSKRLATGGARPRAPRSPGLGGSAAASAPTGRDAAGSERQGPQPGERSDVLGRTALTFTAAALALLPLASAQGLALGAERPGQVIGLIVLLAVGVTVVPYLLYFDGISRIAPATAGVLMMCQLAAANIAGAILLGEAISPVSGLLLAALAGAIILHVALSRSRPTARHRRAHSRC